MAENEIKHIAVPTKELYSVKDVTQYVTLVCKKINLLIDEINVLNANLAHVQQDVRLKNNDRVEKV